MYQLTNEQRLCFGLKPVEPDWVPMVLKPSPYHKHTTVVYREGLCLRKYIASGEAQYVEIELNEQLTEDLKYLLPKTSRGKPTLLTAASMEKRGGTGMCLRWLKSPYNLHLWHEESQRVFYSSCYELKPYIETIGQFAQWVEPWCADTTPEDLQAVAALSRSGRIHVKYREGDVFRFPITRRLYGYGRILLDYRQMKKRKEPMATEFLNRCLVCAVYHIVTERADVTVEELEKLPCLPSCYMTANRIYYGNYAIVGHIPLREKEDWPLYYEHRLRANEVVFQCGRRVWILPDTKPVAAHFADAYRSSSLNFQLPVLLDCISAGNNDPYWASQDYFLDYDLRDPRFRGELERVCAQMGIPPEDILA